MDEDDVDDLAALLERELNELSDEEDEEFNIESNILSNTEAVEEDLHIEDEITLLLASANELAGFRNSSQEQEQTPLAITEETVLPDSDMNAEEIEQTFSHETSLLDYKVTDLTPEEKEIIVDLLQLIVESVERCAPIYHGNKIMALEEDSNLLKSVAELTIMTEDKETEIENLMKSSEVAVSTTDRTDNIGLLDNRIITETKQRKEANILSAQQNDQVIWEESNKFKQEIERERARQEERRLKREQAKLHAIQEKSMIKIQRIVRGVLTRRYTTDLLLTHREKLANEAIERETQKQREEEDRLNEALRLQRAQEVVETQRMGVLERESQQCWKEIAEHLERLRQQEIRQFCAEDSLATAIREVVLQARRRVQAYASLVAQEDEEYDIPGYGSDSSEEDCLEEEEQEESTTVCVGSQHSSNLSAVAATIPVRSSDVLKSAEIDPGTGLSVQLHRSTAAPPPSKPTQPPIRTPAPRGAKAVVAVDPTQGKKWGGSINTAAWNSPTASAATVNQAPDIQHQDKIGRDAEGMRETVSALSHKEDVVVRRPLPYSMSELAALEVERQLNLKIQYSAEGADLARSTMDALFAPSNSSQHQEAVCKDQEGSCELVPAVICALRCWRDWWASRASSGSLLLQRAGSRRPSSSSSDHKISTTSSGGKSRESVVSAKAERENEEALSNSMVDLDTDPLLASELDFCVEGLCSSTFLDKFKNLTKLSLNVNKLTELHGVAGLLNLVSISAKDNKITSLSPLRGLQQLKYLHLDSNRIADISPLSGLTQLTVLCVNSNHISELPQLHCPSLQRLELSRNRLSSVADSCLNGLPVLNHLNLSSNQIATVCGETLSASGMLQTLLLSENRLEVVPHPLRLPLLKNLRLNLNRLTSLSQWEHHPGSSPWPLCTPSLQKLVLSDNQIATLPERIFQTLPLLQELDLSFNALAERDCLLGLANCRLLTALYIQDNTFTTTPVNTPAAGTSRTALAAPQLQQLCQWILSVCPALETVSGNRLDMSLFKDKMEQLWPRQSLDHYIRTSLWPAQHFSTATGVYERELPLVRELISSLQTHHVSQNMLTVRERAVKKDELAANKYASNSKRININPAELGVNGVKPTVRDWDLELMELLKGQWEQLMCLASPPTLTHIAPTAVFLSFTKEHNTKYSTAASSASLIETPPASTSDGTLLMAHSLSVQSTAAPQLLPDRCVITLQQHFRGRRVRKRVSSALQSIRYQDTELDDLFGEDFSLDQDFLDMSFLEEEAPVAMVYGDHIRRRSRPTSSVSGAEATAGVPHLPAAATATTSSVSAKQHNVQADSVNHWVLPADDANSPPRAHTLVPALDRPLTGMSTVSTLSAHSDAPDSVARAYSNNNSSAPSPAGSRTNLLSARSDGQNSEAISMMTSARRSERATQAAMAQDWGINDPRVLAQMMKRTQRIQGFVDQKEKKERDKDPQYRLEQFQKSAQRMGGQATFGNTKTSGSFGGAPRTTRAAAAGGGKRKHMTVPAWMLGGEGDAKDSGDS